MGNFEKAVKTVVEDIMSDAETFEVDWDYVDSWGKLLDWFGSDSESMKEDITYVLSTNGFALFDDGSIEDSDGNIKTYRQLTNAVRKALFV